MHIGIEAQRLFRHRKHGMDVVALELLRRLPALAPDDTFTLFVRPGDDPDCLAPAPNLRIVEVPGRSYPTWEQIALPRAVEAAGVDVLHATANTAPLKISVPTVITLHDVIFLEDQAASGEQSATAYQRLGRTYRRLVVPRAARQAAAIATVSAFEQGRIADVLGMPAHQIDVVHNGVGERFAPVSSAQTRRAVRAKYGLPPAFMLAFGNTAPKKNTAGLVEAYVRYARRAVHPVPLVLADYDEVRLRRLLQAHDAEALARLFILPGYIDQADLPVLYSMTALFIYPSLRESFGLPILEAMRCAAPVLTSATSAMPEVAGDAALLADPHDPVALSAAIERALTDGTLRRRLRDAGPCRAEQFGWDRAAERMLSLYRRVLGVRPSQTHVRRNRAPVYRAKSLVRRRTALQAACTG